MNIIRWPRVLTPNLLSQIIKKQKDPLKALQIFKEVKKRFPSYSHNGPVYATMISILGKAGHVSEMKHVIETMKEDSCECKDTVIASAISTFARAGRLDDAISLFTRLREFNCIDWTQSLNAILQEMVKDSRLEAACRIFEKYSYGWEVQSRLASLNLLMNVLCKMKRSDLASHVFQEMNYQGCYPDKESYRILMKGFCLEGKLNEATHLLYSMFLRISQKGAGEDIVVYRILLDALCDAGKIDEAVEILGKILKKGLKSPKRRFHRIDSSQLEGSEKTKRWITETLIRGAIPSLASYNAMAADLYGEDRVSEGDEVIRTMRARGFEPTPFINEAKVAALCRIGRLDEAMDVVNGEMMTVELCNIVMKGLCDVRKSMVAVEYLGKMSKRIGCVANEETYRTLIHGLCRDGEFVEANRVMEKMLINSYLPDVESYNMVIKGLCGMNRQYEAVIWLEEMVGRGMVPEYSVWSALSVSVLSSMAS